MKKLIAVVKKDLKIIFSRKLDILFLVATPILISLLVAQVFKSTYESVEDQYQGTYETDISSIKTTITSDESIDPETKGHVLEILDDYKKSKDEKLRNNAVSRPNSEERQATNIYSLIFPQISVMFTLFALMGGAFSLFIDKKRGILNRLLLTPLSPGHILIGKMFSVFIISVMQFTVIFIFFHQVFGVQIEHSITGFIITVMSLGFITGSLSILFSAICKSEQSLHMAPTTVILVMSAVGGSMVPLQYLPGWLKKLSVLSVNMWANEAFTNTIWKGGGYLVNNTVLLAAGIIFCVAAVQLWKRELAS